MHAWSKSGECLEHPIPWGKFGVFTTLRILPGLIPLHKMEHLHRLTQAALSLNLHWIPSFDQLSQKIEEYFSNPNRLKDQLLRICLFENCLAMSSRRSTSDGLPVKGRLLKYRRPQPSIKSTAEKELYGTLQNLNIAEEDLIIIDPADDRILESATSNLIFVQGDVLIVPEKKILIGITLQKLLPLLDSDFSIIRKTPTDQEVFEFDEILLCGTGRGVAPLAELKELNWSSQSGDSFQKIRSIYENLIKVENAPV